MISESSPARLPDPGVVKELHDVAFVSWTPHHRAEDISHRLGGYCYVPTPWARSLPLPIRYLLQFLSTSLFMLRKRPQYTLFTNPPFVSGLCILLTSKITRTKVIADCHSGTFTDPKWSRFSVQNRWVLERCDVIIFHNYPQERLEHVPGRLNLVISTDGMRDRRRPSSSISTTNGFQVFVPASYSFDEPIVEMIETAGMLDQTKFIFTGKAPAKYVGIAPKNVVFTGWLSEIDYHETLEESHVVLCLTDRENTMQGGVLEALEHGLPAITSDTEALREWSQDVPGVLLVKDHSVESIAAAISTIQMNFEDWKAGAETGCDVSLQRAHVEICALVDRLTDAEVRT